MNATPPRLPPPAPANRRQDPDFASPITIDDGGSRGRRFAQIAAFAIITILGLIAVVAWLSSSEKASKASAEKASQREALEQAERETAARQRMSEAVRTLKSLGKDATTSQITTACRDSGSALTDSALRQRCAMAYATLAYTALAHSDVQAAKSNYSTAVIDGLPQDDRDDLLALHTEKRCGNTFSMEAWTSRSQ
jgi:type II secretory pathway pseudopilin PulG